MAQHRFIPPMPDEYTPVADVKPLFEQNSIPVPIATHKDLEAELIEATLKTANTLAFLMKQAKIRKVEIIEGRVYSDGVDGTIYVIYDRKLIDLRRPA